MALLEQFCIRIDKGLFDDAESVEGFTAFFARLLPTLCAYARHTSTFEAMAFKINGHIAGNNKYASSQYTAAVCESNVRAIRIAPEPAFESGSKSKRSIEIASTTFAGKYLCCLQGASAFVSIGMIRISHTSEPLHQSTSCGLTAAGMACR